MEKGLGADTNPTASVKMLPTFVRSTPDGTGTVTAEGGLVALPSQGWHPRPPSWPLGLHPAQAGYGDRPHSLLCAGAGGAPSSCWQEGGREGERPPSRALAGRTETVTGPAHQISLAVRWQQCQRCLSATGALAGAEALQPSQCGLSASPRAAQGTLQPGTSSSQPKELLPQASRWESSLFPLPSLVFWEGVCFHLCSLQVYPGPTKCLEWSWLLKGRKDRALSS